MKRLLILIYNIFIIIIAFFYFIFSCGDWISIEMFLDKHLKKQPNVNKNNELLLIDTKESNVDEMKLDSNYYDWHDLRKNPTDLPNNDGWIECWLHTNDINYSMDLYYYQDSKQFIDNRRKNVFELYKVIDFFGNQIYTDDIVNRTNEVVAWKYIEPFNENK